MNKNRTFNERSDYLAGTPRRSSKTFLNVSKREHESNRDSIWFIFSNQSHLFAKNIPVERQRLIFQGRELKDTNSLQEFGK